MTHLKANEYQCDNCKGVFEKGWSDEEADAEAIANGFGPLDEDDNVLICDECFNKFKPWAQNEGLMP